MRLGPPRRLQEAEPQTLWGFGAQFDTDLFTPLGQPGGITPERLTALRATIANLKPGHSRIFVRKEAVEATPDGERERAALMKTIALAQETGANVNLTWWQGPYPAAQRRAKMDGFAAIVEEARAKGFDCVTHATIQNEVNNQDIAHQHDPQKSMELYRELYVLFDAALGERKLRGSIRLVGGDLVHRVGSGKAGQDAWLAFMRKNMDDLLDGYSIHVYWTIGDLGKFETRLDLLTKTVARLGITKPIYVTEYGVRGTEGSEPGTVNGRNVEDTVEAGFEHAWFNALASQSGCVGLAKWALYRTDGPNRPFKGWGMIDAPSKDFARTSTYRVTWLFNRIAPVGWRAAGLARGEGMLLSAFAGPAGAHSAVALNRDDEAQSVQVAGLQAGARYFGADWNRNGDGAIHALPRVDVGPRGLTTVRVPPHGLVTLSSRSFGL